MEIDINAPVASQPPTQPSTKQVSSGSPAAIRSTTEDRETFNSDKTSVQLLTIQALQTPEIRQDKVDAIRESIKNGSYKLDLNKIASAIIANNE